MKKDAKTFKEVAERCTRYNPSDNCNCGCGRGEKNSTSETISCSTCTHYTPDDVCDIDLYEEIVNNHNL